MMNLLENKEVRAALIMGVLFFIVANPELYKLVERVLGGLVPVVRQGCQTQAGVAVHAVVFALVAWAYHRYLEAELEKEL